MATQPARTTPVARWGSTRSPCSVWPGCARRAPAPARAFGIIRPAAVSSAWTHRRGGALQSRRRLPGALHRSSGPRDLERLTAFADAPRTESNLVWESTDEDWDLPFTGPGAGTAGEAEQRVIVALGKFDAMHRGHRLLALTAAQMGGAPWLLSFSGMGEVLGWPDRKPLVAPCDRPRVLESWGGACWSAAERAAAAQGRAAAPRPGVLVPRQRSIPFAEIRSMSPEEFVELLAVGMRVRGVVAGTNYRFGFRAAGDADLLLKLGAERSLQVRILELLQSCELDAGDAEECAGPSSQVSSSKIREALQSGTDADMARVRGWLDRDYRSVAVVDAADAATAVDAGCLIRLPASAFQNLLPAAGVYQCRAGVTPLPDNGQRIPTTLDEADGAWWEAASAEVSETGDTVTVRLQGSQRRGIANVAAGCKDEEARPLRLEKDALFRICLDFTGGD